MDKNDVIEITVDLEFGDFWRPLFWQHFRQLWLIYFVFFFISIPILGFTLYALATHPAAKLTPVLLIPLLPLLAVLLGQWSVYSSAKRSTDAVRGSIFWQFSPDGYISQPWSGRLTAFGTAWRKFERKTGSSCFSHKSRSFLLYQKDHLPETNKLINFEYWCVKRWVRKRN